MKFVIKSRKLGKELTFSVPGTSYIYVDINGQPGTLGSQICHGGDLAGSTMSYSGEDEKAFEKICRKWYMAYMRNTKGCDY